jgi:hypothetical protein
MLERSKYMALSRTRVQNNTENNEIEKRMDQLTLNKLCLEYLLDKKGQSADFFKSLGLNILEKN